MFGRVRFKLNSLKTQFALRIFTQNGYMKRLRLVLLGTVLFVACHVSGQAKLGIQFSNFPTHITIDSVTNVTAIITNYGDAAFNGTVSLSYSINGGTTQSSSDTPALFSFDTLTPFVLDPGGSQSRMVQVDPTQQNITSGTSVVVIWPFSILANADTTTTTLQVTPALSSGLKSLADVRTEVFINQQQLFIQTTAENYLKHVRVYDLQGRLVVDQNLSSSTALNMIKYATGCYLVELTFVDDSQKVYKVVNSGLK